MAVLGLLTDDISSVIIVDKAIVSANTTNAFSYWKINFLNAGVLIGGQQLQICDISHSRISFNSSFTGDSEVVSPPS
ncbi:Hypothetical predicted protein [Octopus vulgaris]|uniref:Uncharacterized protein n=1 Tax=Octopus vulgaris TaxID=6645 RepID=A0AA36B5Q4_OCTVU|nr:Hypothetical predicted protein [Octopus vulgaris]